MFRSFKDQRVRSRVANRTSTAALPRSLFGIVRTITSLAHSGSDGWGGSNLQVPGRTRQAYIDALLPPGGFRSKSDAMLRSTASAAFKSVAAEDGMITVDSMCGIASVIRQMPMPSVIDLVASR